MTSEVEGSYAPLPRPDVRLVEVGDEAVLVDGWDLAMVLNATGALIWRRLDGQTTVQELARHLAVEAGADLDEVARDVAGFVDRLGTDGVLEGCVSRPHRDEGELGVHDEPEIEFVPVPPVGFGSVVAALQGMDRCSAPAPLIDPDGGHRLLVKWNPHCGYCAATVRTMDDLRPALAAAGVDLLLVCIGDVEAMQQAAASEARATGIDLPLVFASDDVDPFPGVGTPSAYHVDGDGTVVSPTAHGAEDVPALAATLAGVGLDQRTEDDGTVVRYLRRRGGMCPSDITAAPGDWTSTRVYRIAGHHIGMRVDAEATGAVLDRLFPGARVHDDRAGHSYSVSLPGAATSFVAAGPHRSTGSQAAGPKRAGAPTGARALNVFATTGGAIPLRTRNPGRVLRALLAQLDDDLLGRALPTGSVRVMARAVVIDGEAVLLPPAVDGFAPRLQPVLACMGAALVDVTRPVVDLATGSLVVEPPMVDHDPAVVADLAADLRPNSSERPAVPTGRYPLRSWCVVRVGRPGITALTPAAAAATTVSTVFDTEDSAARVHQLGGLFAGGRTRGLALWYDDDQSFFATLEAAVTWRPDLTEGP
jgi:hypothetical protein